MLWRLTFALTVSLVLLGLGAGSARADEIALTVPADAVPEDVPVNIIANWISDFDEEPAIAITYKRGAGLSCGSTFAEDAVTSSTLLNVRTSTSPYVKAWTPKDPGAYTLCGFARDTVNTDAPNTYAVSDPVTLNVRSAVATVAIGAPARVDVGSVVDITVPFTAELQRRLYLTIKSADAGQGCAASHALDDPVSLDLIGISVLGSATATAKWTAPAIAGMYLLCAYVQELAADPAPEAGAALVFRVGPDPCVVAKAALTAAAQALKAANATVNRNRTAYTRADRKAKRAHGARRQRLRRQAKRLHTTLQRSVTRRSTFRGRQATAQVAVSTACGI